MAEPEQALFHSADVQTCLFAAFSYATAEAHDAGFILKNFRFCAKPGGLLIFDVVNAEADIHPRRAKCASFGDSKVSCGYRKCRKCIDCGKSTTSHGRCLECNRLSGLLVEIDAHYSILRPNIRDSESWREKHVLRAYRIETIEPLLRRNSFQLVEMFDLESVLRGGSGEVTQDSYYITVIARAT
jgi:hypothetical protein